MEEKYNEGKVLKPLGEYSPSEERIRKIVKLYYANQKIQKFILEFAKDREVVPRYFENFGKRPDTLLYKSDIDGLVKRGATSFHCSEEIWEDPLKINSDMSIGEFNKIRKGWDLVIDVDSQYFDLSKLLTGLIVMALEAHGIKNYWIKFSGNKGFHIILSWNAFPKEYLGMKTKDMFPEWPKIICKYLMDFVRRDYNKKAKELMGNIETIKERTNLTKDDFMKSTCPNCGRAVKKGVLVTLKCHECGFMIKRKDMKIIKRKLICPQNGCPGILEFIDEGEYFKCEHCKDISSIDKRETSGKYKAIYTKDAIAVEDFEEEISGELFGSSDLVLVSPRHLFRMPYSLHEKTALASVIIGKNEIEKFELKDAEPLRIKIRELLPRSEEDVAYRLLSAAIDWGKRQGIEEEKLQNKEYEKINLSNVSEDIFPKPIKKLLKGLKEGRKRGLFVLITFLRTLNFSAEYINKRIREWNKLNEPPLKEGYIKAQIDWHLKQKRQILPPNYSNDNFYKDLGLLDEKPEVKNPIVEVLRSVRKSKNLFK